MVCKFIERHMEAMLACQGLTPLARMQIWLATLDWSTKSLVVTLRVLTLLMCSTASFVILFSEAAEQLSQANIGIIWYSAQTIHLVFLSC